jgi:phenylpropionate dioxygenase-like ring-hydroxylating dioxygenase large terminal subunit
MPMPFGWFQVAWSDEVESGTSVPAHYFGRHLAIWRDEAGAAHVWDAFCAHMGAHFGHRAKVEGETITCALHGWRYDADGRVLDIPYSDRINKKACVRTYPVVERNGLVMAWYHPTDAPPMWDVPELEEFGDSSDFSEVFRKHYRLGCHWQEIAETQVDAAHIQAHLIEYQVAMNGGVRPDKPTMPQVDSYDTDGPVARIRITQDFPTPNGAVQGRIDTDVAGPGFAATWFTGLVDTLLLGCATPTGPGSCELRFSFVVRKSGDAGSTTKLGKAFIEEIHERTVEDVEVWENKAYVPRPALAHGDGPIMQYRRWCEQFYAEGVDPTTEMAVPEEREPDGVLVDLTR